MLHISRTNIVTETTDQQNEPTVSLCGFLIYSQHKHGRRGKHGQIYASLLIKSVACCTPTYIHWKEHNETVYLPLKRRVSGVSGHLKRTRKKWLMIKDWVSDNICLSAFVVDALVRKHSHHEVWNIYVILIKSLLDHFWGGPPCDGVYEQKTLWRLMPYPPVDYAIIPS